VGRARLSDEAALRPQTRAGGVGVLLSTPSPVNPDCNGNGVVGFDDINPFVAMLSRGR
jgi:hypothetical protein